MDVVCPWAYIGKRRMERAVADLPGVEVVWRPYRIDPAAPVPAEPLRFGRQSARRDGTLHPVEFSVVIPDLGGTAVGSFVCHHHTADEVWHPGLLDHANGATRLAAVEVAEADDASWESMRKVAEADGPPFRLPNTTIGQGPARLVVAARETASAEIAGATVELVGS